MKVLKTLGLMVIVSAFLMGFSVTASYAQPGKAGWGGNQGKHKGWSRGNHNGWNKGRKTGWNRNYDRWDWWRNGRISDRERHRLSRQRDRIYNSRSRYYRDGYLTDRERYKLYRKHNNYRRNVYRSRNDWN